MDARLHRLAVQAEVELASLGAEGVKRLFQRGAPRPPAQDGNWDAISIEFDRPCWYSF
jgi:hypothetical protein